MREDCYTDIIRYDELAIVYGNYLCNKYRKPHLQTMIRSKLRLTGRLLIVIKNDNRTITDFSSILQPKYYDEIIAAVNKVAILGENNCYRSPATAFFYGTLLKKCAKFQVNECIKKEDEEQLRKCRDFQSIIEEDFASSVNRTVEENQKEMRRHKKVNLPAMDDVRKLRKYLDSNRNKCFDFLTHNSFDFGRWKQLSEYTLTSIQMFNRRRAGEIERITIEDYRFYEAVDEKVDTEIFNSLTKGNKILAKQYIARRKRKIPQSMHPYKKIFNSCGAQNPHTLRVLNIQEEEVDDLANFLGHANKIHKEHYRMPIVTRDIVLRNTYISSNKIEKYVDNSVYYVIFSTELTHVDTSVDEDISANTNHSNQISLDGIHQSPSIVEDNCRKTRSVSPTGRVKRVSWSEKEKKVALDLFAFHIQSGSMPSTSYCFDRIKENPVLKNRSPIQLKSWRAISLQKKGSDRRPQSFNIILVQRRKKLMYDYSVII
ncbi:hypothetical protein JTB14_037480 [Gonioctena quinquepunctata]|nr:hypothetical protein JTB14_037480 [Gonioctena quinquepunctata]